MLEQLLTVMDTAKPGLEGITKATITGTFGNIPYGFHHAPAVYNGMLYTFGYYTGSASTYAGYFNPSTGTLTAIRVTPTAMFGSSTVVYNNKFYIFGGTRGDASKNIIVYDPATNTYSRINVTLPITGHFKADIKGSKVYFAASESTSSFYSFDIETETLTEHPLPTTETIGATGCIIKDNYLYIAGGWKGGSARTLSNRFFKVDLSTMEVIATPTLPQAQTCFSGMFVWGDFIVFSNGNESTTKTSRTYSYFYYDIEANIFVNLPARTGNDYRNYGWNGLIGNRFYYLGGITDNTGRTGGFSLKLDNK